MTPGAAFPPHPFPARRGRFCSVPLSNLRLHAEAFYAYKIFLEAGLTTGRPAGIVEVIRDEAQQLLWFSGFDAMASVAKARGFADVHIWTKDALDETTIRLAAWQELCCPPAPLASARAAYWFRLLSANLPRDVARYWFGPRGLNHSSAARRLGIGRTRFIHHLQTSDQRR